MSADYTLVPEFDVLVTWSRGSCGTPGCTDAECGCALCRKPIGLPEDDPHFESCDGCELCEDQVPMILFRGEGRECMQAAFHLRCFNSLLMRPA